MNGTINHIAAPGLNLSPLGLPKAVHYCGPREISITMPPFDDTAFLLFPPHYLDFAIDPSCDGRQRFPVIEIESALYGIGITIRAVPLSGVSGVAVDVAEDLEDCFPIGRGLIDEIDGVEPVVGITPGVSQAFGDRPACLLVEFIIKHTMVGAGDLKNSVQHEVDRFFILFFDVRFGKMNGDVELTEPRNDLTPMIPQS